MIEGFGGSVQYDGLSGLTIQTVNQWLIELVSFFGLQGLPLNLSLIVAIELVFYLLESYLSM
jgi:hypothetical protein